MVILEVFVFVLSADSKNSKALLFPLRFLTVIRIVGFTDYIYSNGKQ